MTDIVKIRLRHRVVKSSIWTLRFLQVGFHVLIYHNYDHIKYFPRQSVKQLWERGGGGTYGMIVHSKNFTAHYFFPIFFIYSNTKSVRMTYKIEKRFFFSFGKWRLLKIPNETASPYLLSLTFLSDIFSVSVSPLGPWPSMYPRNTAVAIYNHFYGKNEIFNQIQAGRWVFNKSFMELVTSEIYMTFS